MNKLIAFLLIFITALFSYGLGEDLDQTVAVDLCLNDWVSNYGFDNSGIGLEDKKLVKGRYRKHLGVNLVKVYEGKDEIEWFVKSSDNPAHEYLGAMMMNLLFGSRTPIVKIVRGEEMHTASRNLVGFVTEFSAPKSKRYGEGELVVALDWLGIADRNDLNMGYVLTEKGLEATRVDYDDSFLFHNCDDIDSGYLNRLLERYRLEEVEFMMKTIRDLPEEVVKEVMRAGLNTLRKNEFRVDERQMSKILRTLLERKRSIGELLLF